MNIGAVVLAAGASSRLGEPKQLLRDHSGETLVHKVAREALAAGAQPVVIVLGADANEVREAVADLSVNTVVNTGWSEGISSSIRLGVRTVAALKTTKPATASGIQTDSGTSLPATSEGAPVDAVLILTCDMPSVGVAHLTLLLQKAGEGVARVASAYDYTRGIPAIIRRDEFAFLEALTGDRGAKALLMRKDTAAVPLANGAFDLDTRENVAVWRAAGSP